jgi:hypothetical protein
MKFTVTYINPLSQLCACLTERLHNMIVVLRLGKHAQAHPKYTPIYMYMPLGQGSKVTSTVCKSGTS